MSKVESNCDISNGRRNDRVNLSGLGVEIAPSKSSQLPKSE